MSTIATFGNNWVGFGSAGSIVGAPVDPNNPLGLPAFTVRARYADGATPTAPEATHRPTFTQVSSSPNVWDAQGDSNWTRLLSRDTNLLEILGANSTGVTTFNNMCQGCTGLISVNNKFDLSSTINVSGMFNGCTSLTTVPLFDTSSITGSNSNMRNMFRNCTSLTSVPLFNTAGVQILEYMLGGCTALRAVPLFSTASAKNVGYMLDGCVNVESGALALYTQMSTQTTPPTSHTNTFLNCGSQSVTGAQELAQIPSSWGGTGE